jgi:hypothetical protein
VQVTYRLADEDYRALAHFLMHQTPRGKRVLRRQIVGMCAFSLAGVAIVYALRDDRILAILFGGFCFVLMNLMRRHAVKLQRERIYRLIARKDDSGKHPPGTLKLTPEALEAETSKGTGAIPWSGVTRVARDASHIFIILGKANAFAVPRRDFESQEAFDAFYNRALEYHARTRTAHPE